MIAQADPQLPLLPVIVGILAMIVSFFVLYLLRFRKVGPNEALIISGRQYPYRNAKGRMQTRGFRIQIGGGTFVWPVFEKAESINLAQMAVEAQAPEVYASGNIPVIVDGVAQIKVKADHESIARAAEHFLSKPASVILGVGQEILEGHLRAVIGELTADELYQDREAFADRVLEATETDFANMGLQCVTFTIKNVGDSQGYFEAKGKSRAAGAVRDAKIAKADADRDAELGRIVEEARALEAARAPEPQFTTTCPLDSCGAENPVDARYCCKCAAPISGDSP